MFHVYVEGLEFHGRHGVSAEERTIGHRFVVDLRLAVEGSADRTDRIEETVDYGEAVAEVLAVSEEHSFLTIEAFARSIAERLLGRFQLASEVRIKLAKRLPPISYVAQSAAVELTVRR